MRSRTLPRMEGSSALKRVHPAKFSDTVLETIVRKRLLPLGRIIDPFSGVGRVHDLANPLRFTVGVEIELPWASARRNTVRGNSRHLPFRDESFDAAVCSPTYGNRLSDHHVASDPSRRRSYTHDLQVTTGDPTRRLHPDNSGQLYAWQPAYWELHEAVWRELWRVLRPSAPFILNTSDCVRKGKIVPVVARHRTLLQELGYEVLKSFEVGTPRLKFGENRERVPSENLTVYRRK